MRIIDCQSHLFPREYAERLVNSTGQLSVNRIGTEYAVIYGGVPALRVNPDAYDLDTKIRDMDNHGIDVSVLSINIPGPELVPKEQGPAAARLVNEYVSGVVRSRPDRFVGLAVIPWQDPEAAQVELLRATEELELRGVMLYSHLAGKPVDSPEFEPIFATAADRQIPLVIHPTFPVWSKVIADYSMIPMFGMMVDTSIAMLRIILSGLLERYPNLRIVHPHGGGVLPYLMPRVVEQTEVKGRGRENITRSPDSYYSSVYLDLVTPSTQAMQYAVDFAGASHCVFGTDHPWVQIGSLLEYIAALKLTPAERDQIMSGNACELFGIPT